MQLKTEKIKPARISWEGLTKRFMNPGELETLVALVASVKPEVVIEFGVNEGRTAKSLLREIPSIRSYIGVDVLPGYVTAKAVQRKEVPLRAGHMVEHDPRVTLHVTKRGSFDLSPKDLPEADVVFIDGDHSRAGVVQDTTLARCTVRKGGLIIWHDYHNLGKVDVREVLHEFRDEGAQIIHAEGTWLAFERV